MDDNFKEKYEQALIQIKRLEIEREAIKQINQACVNVYEQTGIFCAFGGKIDIQWDLSPEDVAKGSSVTVDYKVTPTTTLAAEADTGASHPNNIVSTDPISREQIQMIEREAGKHKEIIRALLRQCNLESLALLPKGKYYNALDYVRKNVAAKEGRLPY